MLISDYLLSSARAEILQKFNLLFERFEDIKFFLLTLTDFYYNPERICPNP